MAKMHGPKKWRILRGKGGKEDRLLQRIGIRDEQPDVAEIDRQRKQMLRRLSVKDARKRYLKWGSVAAILLLLIGSGFYSSKGTEKLMVPTTVSISTGAGEILSHSLPDGSTVHLSANSELTYPAVFDRKVTLSGYALFEVVRDTTHRFLVVTDQADIEVLGTTFTVDDRIQQTEITLESGALNVYPRQVRDTLQLRPGDQVQVRSTRVERRRVPTPAERQTHVALKDRLFVFNETPLTEVASEIDRFYGLAVTFENYDIGQRQLTGRIRIRSVDELLAALEVLLDLQIDRGEEEILIRSSNETR